MSTGLVLVLLSLHWHTIIVGTLFSRLLLLPDSRSGKEDSFEPVHLKYLLFHVPFQFQLFNSAMLTPCGGQLRLIELKEELPQRRFK